MSVADDVERAVAPVVSSLGLELVDLETRPGHVIITLDREGGVDLEAIGGATRAISRALDAADAVPTRPLRARGVEPRSRTPAAPPGGLRPLRRQRRRRAAAGPGPKESRRFSGVLTAADDDAIVVSGPDLPDGGRRVELADLERVHTVFDWRAALAGTSSPGRRDDRSRAGSSPPRPGPATETRTES